MNVTEITTILASTINSRSPRDTSGVRVDLVGMLMKSVISINTAWMHRSQKVGSRGEMYHQQ